MNQRKGKPARVSKGRTAASPREQTECGTVRRAREALSLLETGGAKTLILLTLVLTGLAFAASGLPIGDVVVETCLDVLLWQLSRR